MIIFSELQMQGEKHVHVNSGLLNILISSFKEKNIDIYCDSKHKSELLKYVKSNRLLNFKTFEYTGVKELRKSATLTKTFRESLLAFKIFKSAKKKKIEVIVFASVFPFTAIMVNFFSWIFNQRIIVGLHGDIGVLKLNKNKITTIVYKYVVKLFFSTRSSTVIALFYGKTIEEELFKMFPRFKTKNIISIDHPYNYDTELLVNSLDKSNTVIIANIGTGLMNKNSHLLYQLAEMQRYNVENKKVKFIQVGNVSPEVLSYSNTYVNILNNNEFIPFDVFEKNIMQADYFIYFFINDSLYDLCPSGTFFDAIKYKKPIISLRNPFFEYYFNKLGNIGYLCNSLEHMNEIINSLIQHKNNNLEKQTMCLTRAQKTLTLEVISQSFSEQFKNLSNNA
jgi:hypothetical protein